MPTDTLSTTLAAIADPTRRAILTRLSRGEASVTELARPFDMTMPAITKHLKVLEKAGLVERRREAQWRPCRLRAEPLKDAAAWLETYRAEWEGRLDRMAAYLEQLQSDEASGSVADRSTGPATPTVGDPFSDTITQGERDHPPSPGVSA